MNRTCAIQHELGYHRTQGEETNTCMKPLYLRCNLKCRMGSRGSFGPNGCGFTFRTPDRAQRSRCPGHLRFLSFQRRQG
jgi:hypothetical protein